MSPGSRESHPGLFDDTGDAGPAEPRALTVSQLTREVEVRLTSLGGVRVEGEVSGLKRAASGHVYFDLKDPGARISCIVWRSAAASLLRRPPVEGDQVLVTGRLNVYPPRGTYSLIVERLEPVGLGALLAKLEALKAELAARGWFDRARSVPAMPRLVGVATSRDGAALRDFLKTRSARWPLYPVRLCHTPVQGEGAAREIAAAIDALDASGVDVVAVIRGGGSLEDLWAFQSLEVAEAIWRCSVPVVSGVGHETDVTLADLVADHRAHTPTDAAQVVIPDRGRLVERMARAQNHLARALEGTLEGRADRLQRLAARRALRDADWILDDRARAALALGGRLARAGRGALRTAAGRLDGVRVALAGQSPRARLARDAERLRAAGERLRGRAERRLERGEESVAGLARSLEAVSPLAVLGRGYSLARRRGAAELLRDAAEVAVGDELETRLSRGELVSRVLEVRPGEEGA